MHTQPFFKRSLVIKLCAPIVLIGALLMSAIYFVVRAEGLHLEKNNAIQFAQLVVDDLVVSAQIHGSQPDLIRVVNSLGAFKAVEFLALVDRDGKKVIASTKNKYIDADFDDLKAGIDGVTPSSDSWSESGFLISRHNNEYSFIAEFNIYDPDSLAVRVLDVILIVNSHEASIVTSRTVKITGWVLIATILILVLGFVVVIRAVLLFRINQLKDLIRNEMDQQDLISSSIHVGDELDQVKIMFSEMLGAKKNAEREREKALEDARKNSRAKSNFIANMSHELRTPLNSVIGFSKRILRTQTNLDSRQLKAIESIYSSGLHLLELINDVLDLSKLDAGRLEINIEQCNVSDICQSLYSSFYEEADKKDLSIRFLIANNVIGMVDKLRFKQVAINLISNAIKYTEEGEVNVRLAMEDEQTFKFSVTDTGVGIRKEDQERLFKRFEQFNDQSRFQIGHGTGLGLSIVGEMVQLMKGRVCFESEYGRGSCFCVFLPAVLVDKR